MESDSADSRISKDVDETVWDMRHRPLRIETEVEDNCELKIEWGGEPQLGAHALLSAEAARELAAKLRHAVGLPVAANFRESVIDGLTEELSVFATTAHSGVFLCLGDCYAAANFKELGHFDADAAMELAVALEAGASAIDRNFSPVGAAEPRV